MIEKVQAVALAAGDILLDKMHSGFSIEQKGSIDLVTDADRASEQYIVEQFTKLFPHHSICAEEGGWTERSDEFVWYIDPLDGTTNFAHGFPYFAISLALAKGGEIILGIAYNPVSKECFAAERGSGAYVNGERIRVSKEAVLQNSLLATGFPYDVATNPDDNMRAFEEAYKASQGVRRPGAAALDLCHVACGRFEAFWEKYLKPWDMAAGSLIVTEAGGQISDCNGHPFNPLGSEILASNGLVHGEILQILVD